MKLGKQCGWKAHNLRFIATIYYTGMIIDNCKTFTERLGNRATYNKYLSKAWKHMESMKTPLTYNGNRRGKT
eukprot:3471201-Heterocapsa_arctica.AAC.1